MNRTRTNQIRQRGSKGQIEMFAAELAVGTLVVIGYLFFLLNSGISGYYKEKLGFVSAQGARYAAAYGGKKFEAATSQFVADLCKVMALKPTDLVVKVKQSNISGKTAYSCQVSGTFPLPFFQDGVFPGSINCSDTSMAVAELGAGQTGNRLTVIGIGNKITNSNGIIPTGYVNGILNTFTNVITVGNTRGIGNSNATGNTTGIGNSNTSGNTTGIGNSNTSGNTNGINNSNTTGNTNGIGNTNTSGDTTGIGNSNTSGTTTGIGNSNTSGTTTGIGNSNTSGTTTGIGNSNTSGTTSGIGNSNTSGTTTGIGNSNTSGTTTGIGNSNTSGTTTGIGHH